MAFLGTSIAGVYEGHHVIRALSLGVVGCHKSHNG